MEKSVKYLCIHCGSNAKRTGGAVYCKKCKFGCTIDYHLGYIDGYNDKDEQGKEYPHGWKCNVCNCKEFVEV